MQQDVERLEVLDIALLLGDLANLRARQRWTAPSQVRTLARIMAGVMEMA